MKRKSIVLMLFLVVFIQAVCVAEPGMKITSPQDGSTVNPGQEVTVTVESVEGFVIEGGVAGIAHSSHNENVTSLPCSFTDKIPMESIGEAFVSVFGRDASGNLAMDDVTLKVEQTATLQSLRINQDDILIKLDWNGNIKEENSGDIVTIYGIYSDGIERILSDDPGTSYASSDPSVISIDDKGSYQVYKTGQATITISNSGMSKVIPVVFKKPRGTPPKETIPPAVGVDIQPSANSAGWHNQAVTITITAQDNEGGSGIEGVVYRFPYIAGETTFIKNNQAVIPFSEEGIRLMEYGASDKEGNNTGQKSTTIRIDKTLPQVTITTPANQSEYLLNQVIIANWAAIDNLSGIDSLTATTPNGQSIDTTQAGAKDFKVSCQDKAGNTATNTVKYYLRYNYSGILAPLKSDGSSVFKLGRTIPFKFQIQDADSSYITTAQAGIYLAKISDDVAGQEVEGISTSEATSGNLFRYDSQDSLYIFNLSTNTLTSGTWQARIELDDGTSKYVNFGLK